MFDGNKINMYLTLSGTIEAGFRSLAENGIILLWHSGNGIGQ